jgi:hypothetical protein
MPDNMPADMYLNTFEKDIHAATAHFYARSFNWQFAAFRDYEEVELQQEWERNDSKLKLAIDQDFQITEFTIKIVL